MVSDPNSFHADPDPGFRKPMQIWIRIRIQGFTLTGDQAKKIIMYFFSNFFDVYEHFLKLFSQI